MKNLFKNPKTRKRNLILAILPFVILAGICGFIAFKSVSSISGNAQGNSKDSYKDSIDSMDYHLRSNATKYQTELFKDLTKVVEDGSDKYEIARLVAENYVADFYTWSNKDGTYDVGGMYYVYSPQKTAIYTQARNTYYKYVTYYINQFGAKNLLEVENITSTLGDKEGSYEFEGKKYDSYFVTCEWTYKNEDTFKDINMKSGDGFVKKEYFTIIEKDGRFEIVQAYGDN
mgnify:FL=1